MSIFRRTPEKTYEQMRADAVEKAAIQTHKSMTAETAMLDKIGESIDPVAEDALDALDRLPLEQRLEFVQGVFRRLVVQSLYTSKSLDMKNVESLPYSTLHYYGTGFGSIDMNGSLRSAIVDESLPQYEQPELELF